MAATYRVPGEPGDSLVLVGCSRAFWPRVCEFARSHPEEPDPVDTLVGRVVLGAVTGSARVRDVRFSHEPPPRRVVLQRLASLTGMCWLCEQMHLCVHPSFGVWVSFRAVIVLAHDAADPMPEQSPVIEGPLFDVASMAVLKWRWPSAPSVLW